MNNEDDPPQKSFKQVVKKKSFLNSSIHSNVAQDVLKNHLDFQLVAENDVLVTGSYQLFDDNLKGILKQYGQGVFSYEDRGYIIKLQHYEPVIERIKIEKQNIILRQIPKLAFEVKTQIDDKLEFKIQKDRISIQYDLFEENEQLNISKLPQIFKDKLYQFQKDGIVFGLKAKGRLLIGDEMGVGKTIQALALAYIFKEDWPLLIICPSSLRLNWRDEVKRWLTEIQLNQIQVIAKSDQQIQQNARIIITSYDLATKMCASLQKLKFRFIIADEAHYLKNQTAKRTETLCPLLKSCKRIILLTGTPALNKPKELFTILNIIRPDVFMYFRDFGTRYCDPKPSRWKQGLEYEGASNTKELHFILSQGIMIRRLKREVLRELPSKRRQKFTVQVDQKIVKEIQAILSKFSSSGNFNFDELIEKVLRENYSVTYHEAEDRVHKIDREERLKMLDLLHKCWILTGKAKLQGILDYLKIVVENGIKFILFAHHLQLLTEIEEFLKEQNCSYVRIDGDVNMKKRHENVKSFQENSSIKAALLSLTAASIGLTLTEASTVIFAEMYWTPAVMLQAEDRAHRIGQLNSVDCIYMYGEGTLDEKLYSKLESKLTLLSDILDGQKSVLDQSNMFHDYSSLKQEVQEDIKAYYAYNGIQDPIKNKQITDYFSKKETFIEQSDQQEHQEEYIVIDKDKFKFINKPSQQNTQKYNKIDDDDDNIDLELIDKILEEYQQTEQQQQQNSTSSQNISMEHNLEENNNMYEELINQNNMYSTPVKRTLEQMSKPIHNTAQQFQITPEKSRNVIKRKSEEFNCGKLLFSPSPNKLSEQGTKKVKTNSFKFI